MNPIGTAPGWHPDPETGGTRYWDGSRWTGDVRPRRRAFAAASFNWPAATCIAGIAGSMGMLMLLGAIEDQKGGGAYLAIGVVLIAGGAVACVYFLRGQGPMTSDVENRLRAERKEAAAKRRKANLWGTVAGVERLVRPRRSDPQVAEAAVQRDMMSDPKTTRALQNLEQLLYSRVLTDAEYTAAKAKLLGQADAATEQIAKLSELHEAGVLGDVEFAAAKARVLGL